jgi:hypothetical protein
VGHCGLVRTESCLLFLCFFSDRLNFCFHDGYCIVCILVHTIRIVYILIYIYMCLGRSVV